MNPFKDTEAAIDKDIEQVFREILNNYLVATKDNDDLTHIHNVINRYIPKKIINKNLLLLDTVLNYLTEDAINILEESESEVLNPFYESNRNWIKELKTEFQRIIDKDSVALPPDPRVDNVFRKALPFLARLISKEVLDVGVPVSKEKPTTLVAREKIDKDVMKYIEQSQAQTKQGLKKIIEIYESKFNKFLEEHQILDFGEMPIT